MINVNQITAQLSRMPDNALQQYANMHKADPYILSLAVSESNRRKQMRTASQGQGAMPQPKVADAEIAGMAMPEDMGIGQLPAHNIQGMAGGGIVAFAEGDYVDPMGSGMGYGGYGGTDEDLTILERLGVFNPENRRALEAGEKRIAEARAKQKAAAPTADKAAPVTTDKGGLGALGANLPPAQPAAPQLQSGLPGFLKAAEQFAPEKAESQESFLARQKAAIGESPLAAQTERLEKREKAASGEKEDALNMALIKAGLGMMAGKSQYALQNIGEGGAAGLADYNESIKDLKKAALEREKMRNDLENAQYAYKRGDFDAYEKAREKAQDRRGAFQNHLVSGLASITGSETSARAHLAAAGMMYDRRSVVSRDVASKEWASNPMIQMKFPNFEDYYKMLNVSPATGAAPSPSAAGWGQAKLVSP